MLGRLRRVVTKVGRPRFFTSQTAPTNAVGKSLVALTGTLVVSGLGLYAYNMDEKAVALAPPVPPPPPALEVLLHPRLVHELVKPFKDFSPQRVTGFVDHEEFETHLEKVLTTKVKTMNVLWAPPGAGKTTYVWKVCQAWQQISPKTRKVFYVDDYKSSSLNGVLKDLNVKSIADLSTQLAENPDFQVVLVLDSFDTAFENYNQEEVRKWLLDLREASSTEFRVLCVMSKPHKAKTVLELHNEIGLCGTYYTGKEYKLANFKWTRAQIDQYMMSYGTTFWTHREKRNFSTASRCGNITFMNKMITSQCHLFKPYFWDKTFKRRLAMYEDRWAYGTALLGEFIK
jgi:GTPase SAR1 family protein